MTARPHAPDPIIGLALAMQSAPGRFALLVGSGISGPSGIPTGWAVVSDLAGKIAVANGEPEPPADAIDWYVKQYGDAPDYSGLLNAVAPTPAQRRDLLASYFEPTESERDSGQKTPTRAHRAIAKLVARGTVRIIVTTNFDRLLEQAIQAEGIEPVVVATSAAAEGSIPLAHSKCTIVKVHGDYLDPNVKNTVGELNSYEPPLDAFLDRVFDDYGLVVCGWSGTWDPALRHAIERCPTRRYGTYWAARGELAPEALRIVAQRAAEVIAIEDADALFDSLLSKVEALDDLQRRSATGVDVVIAEAKRYLPDPAHRIRLHDLVMDTAERVLRTIDFDGNPPNAAPTEYIAKVREIENAAGDVVAVAAIISQFADTADQRDLLGRLVARLASVTDVQLGGFTAWISLRGYPALLVMYAAGLTAIANENWETLARLLSVLVNDRNLDRKHNPVPLPAAFVSWSVLDHGYINSTFPPAGRKTPVSDHLHDFCAVALVSQLRMSEESFAQLFDQWEYLLGVVTNDVRGRGAIGRFALKHRYSYEGETPDKALLAATPALLGRGLFGGTIERMVEVRNSYDEMVRQSGLRF